MVVTIHQPEHLPWSGFFHKVDQTQLLVVLDSVQFRKNYFGNRNRLLGPRGQAWVTVPIHLKGHLSSSYRDIRVVQGDDWRRRYLTIVEDHYRKHPYYSTYGPWLASVLNRPWTFLVDLNMCLIRGLLEHLGSRVELLQAGDLAVEGRSSLLVLNICKRVGAKVYLAGSMGRNYLDEDSFLDQQIEIRHNRFQAAPYPQWGSQEFISHLSVLDLLMNCGPDSLAVIRQSGPAETLERTASRE